MKNDLDQFYTKDAIAKLCWNHLNTFLHSRKKNVDDLFFLEPSAGSGSFFNLMPEDRRLGIDLHPQNDGIIKQDFLKIFHIDRCPRKTVVVGNPPFGKKSNLAIAFFNHASRMADTVAFILPIIFQKFFVHKDLDQSMKFVSKLELPKESFEFPNGKPFSVNTEFQIWTRLECELGDLREYEKPAICHSDFKMWQYNNTPKALKVFENEFDFAVPSQGWQDYSRRETKSENCEKNKQWLLFKAKDKRVLSRLMNIDYEKLSMKYTTAIPGFRKGDLIKEYTELYG